MGWWAAQRRGQSRQPVLPEFTSQGCVCVPLHWVWANGRRSHQGLSKRSPAGANIPPQGEAGGPAAFMGWGQSKLLTKNIGGHHHQGTDWWPSRQLEATYNRISLYSISEPSISFLHLSSTLESQETLARSWRWERKPTRLAQLQASPRQQAWTGDCAGGEVFIFNQVWCFDSIRLHILCIVIPF